MNRNPTKDRAGAMTEHNHQTAPTRFVEANGIRFAYRHSARPAACRSL
jgi:hypothetical protein